MSADNWTTCPRCKRKHDEKLAADRAKLDKSYGKVPAANYMADLKAMELRERAEMPNTLREDYELGTNEDGTFSVNYRCSCSTCDFRYSFKNEVPTQA